MSNCSTLPVSYIPSSSENLESLSTFLTVVFALCGLLTALSLCFYAEFVCFFLLRTDITVTKHDKALWLVGIYPVFCISSFVALLVPRTSMMNVVICSFYLSICVNMFVYMLVSVYGGLGKMSSHLGSYPIVLASPPLCCCCLCLPRLNTTRFRLRVLRCMVLQYAVSQPLLSYVSAILYIDGGNLSLQESGVSMATTWIGLLNGLSTLTAVYAFLLIYRVSRKPLEGTSFVQKFVCLQLVIVFSNLQYSILSALANFDIIPCSPPLSASSNAYRIHQICLIIELFVVELVAWRSYRMSALWRDNDENAILTNSARLHNNTDSPPPSPHQHYNYGTDQPHDRELRNGEGNKYVFYDSSLTTDDDDDVNFLSRDAPPAPTATTGDHGSQANGQILSREGGAGGGGGGRTVENGRRPVLQLMQSTEHTSSEA